MDNKKMRLIKLHHIPTITRKMLRKITSLDPSLKSIFSFTPNEISHYLSLPLEKSLLIHKMLRNERIDEKVQKNLKNVKAVTIFDQSYPSVLRHIHDYPFVLYCLGNVKLLNKTPSISVVGTRRPSIEASKKIQRLLFPLISENWVIVSGLAYGIDSLAHRYTVQENGATIAVLGSGFHYLYPRENKQLFNNIIQSGLVITEYPPHLPAKRYHFPERNRIISGLTSATLVIEAQEKSGTSITVDQALDQGKNVYAVPGSILIPQTEGCHRMIQEGAKLVMNATDILEDYI